MSAPGLYKKFSIRDALFFVLLFLVCVAGSVMFLWFAVGIQSGNVIIKNFFRSMLDNAVGIVLALVVFNIVLVLLYSHRRS